MWKYDFETSFVGDWFIARTGYTGEDGFEIVLPAEAAVELWAQPPRQGIIYLYAE